MLYGFPDHFLGAHGAQATQHLETLTASDRALAALLRFQEKPESDCVNFLLETNTLLKPGGCGLGVKGGNPGIISDSCCLTSSGSQSQGLAA